jgi:CTP:phosphocholine cytidylyltransferase-like protein
MEHFQDKFYRLKLSEKFELLINEAEYIAFRNHEEFTIHLFSHGAEYIEMWMDKSEPNSLYKIDIMEDNEILKLYSEQFDPKKDLGL